MKRKSVMWVALIFLAVVAGAVSYYLVSPSETRQEIESGEAEFETAVARLGDLSILASGTGQVVPATEAALSFDENGVLMDILVSIGEKVAAGEVLARLKTNKTPVQITADLANAKLAVIKAEQALNDIYTNAEIESAQALKTVEEAQQALDDLLNVAPEQASALRDLVNTEQAVENAEMDLYILNSSPSDDAIEIAYASLLFKEEDLADLQEQVEKLEYQIKIAPNEDIKDRLVGQLHRLNVQLIQQQIEVENGEYKYTSMDDPADPLDLAVAEARLETAQAQLVADQQTLENIQDGPAPSDVALAESKLGETQAEWERLKDGPDPNDIALAEAELEIAQLELQVAQQQQTIVELIAPVDGTVLSIHADVGERIGTGTLISIANMDQPRLEIFIDETDLDKVQLGNPVEVIFDALPDDTFTGTIVDINPGLVTENRVQAIRALVRLDDASYAKPISLPIGLSASVDVIGGQTENAVLIPIEALREINPEEYGVYVMENDQPQLRPVLVGLMDFTSAEILEGIAAGEVVVIGDVE